MVQVLRRIRWGIVAISICTISGCTIAASAFSAAVGDKKDAAKPSVSQEVDSGSFGVMVRGQRVVTETFSVRQENDISIVKSQLQEAGSSPSINQKSELRMMASGELVRYDWTDGSGSLAVTPKDEFLLEKITASPSAKAAERPFLMPNTSAILDNNFFIQREILVWRYLATNCHTDGSNLKCQQGPVEFGALVPQDRTSIRVRVELTGREKVTIHDAERELLRLSLKGEAFSWTLWVDDKDHFKVLRVDIPEDNTQVVRD
jgi:hypothetical protein